MQILLVNRFFGGAQTPSGRMLHDLAVELVAYGHRVVVLTSGEEYVSRQPVPAGRGNPNFDIRLVHQMRKMPRLVNWVWFLVCALVRVPFMHWDRCVLLTDPPFLIVVALLAKRFRQGRRRVILWSMDLFPESLSAAGLLRRDGAVYRILESSVDMGLGAVDGVVALGPTQRGRLAAYRRFRTSPDWCITVPPWDGRILDKPRRPGAHVLERFGWKGQKIALYGGNLGAGHGFQEFLDGARWFQARNRSDWLFVFAVRGSRVPELKQAAAELPNVIVTGYFDETETAALLWSAAVHLISLKEGWEGIMVPSKLYSVVKTDSPILFVGPQLSDTAIELLRWGWGKVLPPDSRGSEVAAALDELGSSSAGKARNTEVIGVKEVAEIVCRE